MTVEGVLQAIHDLSYKRMHREISEEEMIRERHDIIDQARKQLTEPELEKLLDGLLLLHQTIADTVSAGGYQVPGNNSKRPN